MKIDLNTLKNYSNLINHLKSILQIMIHAWNNYATSIIGFILMDSI